MNIREWLGLANKLEQPTAHIKHENANDTDIRSSWEAWDKYWNDVKASEPMYSYVWNKAEKRINISKNVVSKYFASPNDVPSSLADYTNQHMERDIILWAIKNKENNSVMEKCKNISYPVLDVVNSVLHSPDDWDIAYEFKEGPCNTIGYGSTFTYYTYKGNIALGKQNIYGIAFTQLERELIEWCEVHINKIVTERNMSKHREEFNNTWKGFQ